MALGRRPAPQRRALPGLTRPHQSASAYVSKWSFSPFSARYTRNEARMRQRKPMYQAVTSSYRDGHVTAWPQPQRLAQPAPGSLLRTAAQALRYRTALTGAKEPQYPDHKAQSTGQAGGAAAPSVPAPRSPHLCTSYPGGCH